MGGQMVGALRGLSRVRAAKDRALTQWPGNRGNGLVQAPGPPRVPGELANARTITQRTVHTMNQLNPAGTGSVVRVPPGLILPVGPIGTGGTELAARAVRRGLAHQNVVSVRALAQSAGGQCNTQAAQRATADAVTVQASIRLRAGQTALIDGENLARHERQNLVGLAHSMGRSATALLAAPLDYNLLTARARAIAPALAQETLASSVMAWHKVATTSLLAEGFDRVELYTDKTDICVLPNDPDWRSVPGPFLLIGDVHGCYGTLLDLLGHFGFDEDLGHPDGLFPILLGDVNDKGGTRLEDVDDPREVGVVQALRFAANHYRAGRLGWVLGNHERKLGRLLASGEVSGPHGVGETLAAIAAQPDAEALTASLVRLLPYLHTHLQLQDGRSGLVAVHAGINSALLGKDNKKAVNFCCYTRTNWPAEWDRAEAVAFGHVIQEQGPLVASAKSGACVLGLDTGAYEGGGLTGYRTDTNRTITVPTRPSDLAPLEALERYSREAELVLAG